MERCSLDGWSSTGPSRASQSHALGSGSLAGPPSQPTPEERPAQTNSKPRPTTVLRKIPRPPNAFILYRSSKMRELTSKEKEGGMGTGLGKLDYQRQLSKRIGELWRNETEEVKAIFYAQSEQAAKEHSERYPEYRFKPSRRSTASVANASTSTANGAEPKRTPDKKADTDFAPGDRTGPVSGSGSGSGRKRASLEGARSKTSPYSASRHRRSSSIGQVSPTVQRTLHIQNMQNTTSLWYTGPDEADATRHGPRLARSTSQRGPSRSQNHTKTSARKSLDGPVGAASSQHSFSTLVPDQLRLQSQVYYAQAEAPPIPIGQAITTDDSIPTTDVTKPNSPPRPKVSLAEAVKRSLKPERRALLQASLIQKGLLPADQQSPNLAASQEMTPVERTTSAPANQWYCPVRLTSTVEQPQRMERADISQQEWNTQQMAYMHGSWPDSQPDSQTGGLCAALDPANQMSLPLISGTEPTLNIRMDASQAVEFSGLSDWSQPEPCFTAYSQPQTEPLFTEHSNFGAGEQSAYSNVGRGHVSQNTQCVQDPPAHSRPMFPFPQVEVSHYGSAGCPQHLSYELNPSNSAVVALSDPNDAGQVQGHFYTLQGDFMALGTISDTQASTEESQFEQESRRQELAVQQLLTQLIEASSTQSSQSTLINSQSPSHVHASSGPSMSQQYEEWQSWQGSFLSSGVYASQASSQTTNPTTHGDTGPSSSYTESYSTVEQSNSTTCTTVSPQELELACPAPKTPAKTPLGEGQNYSRPIHQASQLHEEILSHHRTAASYPSNGKLADTSTLEVAGLVTKPRSPEKTPVSAFGKGLRCWTDGQIHSIKQKLSRVKHRSDLTYQRDNAEDGKEAIRYGGI